MLRGLVLLFIVVNVGLYFWIDGDPRWGQADREPERLRHQVSPSAIQVLPDLPASAGGMGAASPPGDAASAASSGEGSS
jgi:hypothetical protein